MAKMKGRGKKKKGKKKNKDVAELHAASQRGDVARVLELLDRGARVPVDATMKNGFTALLIACHENHVAVVELLLDRKASIDKASDTGDTPLYIACIQGHVALTELLLGRKASIDKTQNEGGTPLYIACEANHVAVVEALLRWKASMDKSVVGGGTPLHAACDEGHTAVVGLLLEQKASINTADNDGTTALYLACQNDHVELARMLLERKASIDKATDRGFTPLYVACDEGLIAMTRLLLERKPSIDKASKQGATPLLAACQGDHVDVVKLLLEHGATPDPVADIGATPLTVAISAGNLDCVKTMLRMGGVKFDLLLEESRREDLLELFRSPSHAEIAAFVCHTHGFTPLHFACEQRRPALMRALLRSSHGADPSVIFGRGSTIDRTVEEAAIKAETRATRTCRVRVRSHGCSMGWVSSAPEEEASAWSVALDDGEDVDVDMAELERVPVPSLLEVSVDENLGPMCSRTRAIANRAAQLWSPSTHHFFPVRFRRAAITMLCVRHALNTRERHKADAQMALLPRDLPLLGVWFVVLSMCPRDWFEVEGAASSGSTCALTDAGAEQQWCEWCGRPRTATWRPRACTGCNSVYYCDSQCSRANWSEHKAMCRLADG